MPWEPAEPDIFLILVSNDELNDVSEPVSSVKLVEPDKISEPVISNVPPFLIYKLLPLVNVNDEVFVSNAESLIPIELTVNEPVIPTEPLYCEILNVVPWLPCVPCGPVGPWLPWLPCEPVGPWLPCVPVPVAPWLPCEPFEPFAPWLPCGPWLPCAPLVPFVPLVPDVPCVPDVPFPPATPSKLVVQFENVPNAFISVTFNTNTPLLLL